MPEKGVTRAEDEAECGENLFCADTIEELAEKIGVPADALKATVARVNELAAKGEDVDYGKRPALLTTIEKAPFYAFKWGTELIATLGGAVVDEDMRVLDPDDQPIPGLYAAGACAGGFYAVGYPSILAGSDLGSAVTFGKMAAEAIAKA
jgi:predicted oxidoreductase